jgi:hypothetical protein
MSRLPAHSRVRPAPIRKDPSRSPRRFAQIRRLAQTSLCVISAMVTVVPVASCSSTPSERATPPYLSAVVPDPFHIWSISRISAATAGPPAFPTESIAFDVVSEDLGNNLQAAVALDYQGLASTKGVVVGQNTSIPPGHLDDPEPRHVEMSFTVPAGTSPGCHSLTLIVTHEFQPFTLVPVLARDAAYAVWWLDVDDDITAPTATLARCLAAFANGSDGGP